MTKSVHTPLDSRTMHIFNIQAAAIETDVKAAVLAHQRTPDTVLSAWLATPDHMADTPAKVMLGAAKVARAFATGQKLDRAEASTKLMQMEMMRNRLCSIYIGTVVDDIKLRSHASLTPVAKDFATVLTRCCRVLTDVLDDGSASAHAAKSAGQRLSTRQAVELAAAHH